ncbi:MAG TPA: zinc ribbon domain-containing protein [Symbiobacteriaceae bacterium]|jgi:hypothetical protein|nr:zinc ribbon domain-containing protein [Symbiobacteriaceae bacterium]
MTQNFTNNLSQGFAKIKDKAAVLQQTMKLKSRLGDLQKQKTALLAQLGWHALQAHRAGQPIADEAFVQQTVAIAQLEAEEAALGHELAVLEGRGPACHGCGAPLTPGAAFCGNCGTRVGG